MRRIMVVIGDRTANEVLEAAQASLGDRYERTKNCISMIENSGKGCSAVGIGIWRNPLFVWKCCR